MEAELESIRIFKVGGCIRDKFLGIESKDIDYSVVAPSYDAMKKYIESRGKIYIEKPEHQTIRGRIEGLGDVDFVWARKEGPYSDGRRPDWVKPGTLMDDLARRDFTMNAIAEDEEGQLIDPFDGREHIKYKLIACVGDAADRLREDSLRLLRALRFSITKKFVIHPDIEKCLVSEDYLKLLSNVSIERQREELLKMFRANTKRSIQLLFHVYPGVGYTIFDNGRLWLKPTLEEV